MSWTIHRSPEEQQKYERRQRYDRIFMRALVVALVITFVIVAIGAQKACISYVAPWMLDTDDKVAIAIYCKVTR